MPFVFLVTGLPEGFYKWLVINALFPVGGQLGVLFIKNGRPVPYDYVVTLTNYNMRTDSDLLKELTKEWVRLSVVDLLFNKPSNTS